MLQLGGIAAELLTQSQGCSILGDRERERERERKKEREREKEREGERNEETSTTSFVRQLAHELDPRKFVAVWTNPNVIAGDTHMRTHTHACTHTHICMCTHTHTHTHTHARTHARAHTHTHLCVSPPNLDNISKLLALIRQSFVQHPQTRQQTSVNLHGNCYMHGSGESVI